MRLDSQHPGYLTGGHERPYAVDRATSYEPDLPEVAPEVPVLVHDDFVENVSLRPAGMMPFFGLDGVDAPPPIIYEAGVDGASESVAFFMPVGPELDGVNARGAAFPRALIVEPIGVDLDHVALGQPGRVAGPASFHPSDAVEPRLTAALRTGTPPQSGNDGLAYDPPGFDIRTPIIGADGFEYAPARRPVPAVDFMHTGDGIDLRRDRLRFAV